MKFEALAIALAATVSVGIAAPALASGTPTGVWHEKGPLGGIEAASTALPAARELQSKMPPGMAPPAWGPLMDDNSLLIRRAPGKRE